MGFICAVCRKVLTIETRTSLAPCGHVAHHQCWITRSNSCSLCPKCGRTFWRDYLKQVQLEEEESTKDQPRTQTVEEAPKSNTGAPNPTPIAVSVRNLQRELETLKNTVCRREQCGDTGKVIKNEPPDTNGDCPMTIINPNIDWNSIENRSIERGVGQQQVGQVIEHLASAVLPASFSLKNVCTERIWETLNKLSSDINGLEINLSLRKRPSCQKIFRLDIDMTGDVRTEGEGTVCHKERSFTEIDMNLSEPDEKVFKFKFSTSTN